MSRKLLLLAASLLFCASVWGDEVEWKKNFGEDLLNVPLTVRKRYLLSTGEIWSNITPQERIGFLYLLDREEEQRIRTEQQLKEERQRQKDLVVEKAQARASAAEQERAEEETKESLIEAEKQARAAKVERIAAERKRKMQEMRDKAAARRKN